MVAEKTVYAGKTVEVSRYHINHIPKGPRHKKKEESPERIKKANLRRRTDRLRQLMNANFNDSFWSLTLTYRKGEEPESIRGVRDDAADFVRRLRQCARLFGSDLKFIYVIGAGKHRRHIHITVNALPDMAIFTGCWIHGYVSMTRLYSNGQYKDLADYYIKNAQETKEQEEIIGEKPGQMYVTSKNLTQPVEEKRVFFGRFREDPDTIPGYYLEKDSIYKGFTSMGFPLLRYTLIQEKRDAGNETVHLHGCPADRRSNGAGKVSSSVHPGRSDKSIGKGKRIRIRNIEPEGSDHGNHDSGNNTDKRRKQDTSDRGMPLFRGLHGSNKPGAIRKMASKCVEKLKGKRNRARR